MPNQNKSQSSKKLRLFDIVLFNVCAIVGLDTIGAGAGMGVSGMSWRLLGILLFFIPYGFVSAELGSTWPKAGGIYVWTKKAYGEFWGTMVSWLYWINVVYWMPSIYVTFAAVFTSVFFPGLSASGQIYLQIALGVILIWFTVFLGIKNITMSDFVTNTGAIIKTLLFFSLGIFGVVYALKFELANSFALSNWKITWDSTVALAPIIVYNFMGFELVSSFSDKLKSPKTDIPKAIMLGGAMISVMYIISAFGILAIFQVEDINIVTGISDSLNILVAKTLGENFSWLFYLMIVCFLLSLFAFMFSWALGANCVIGETGLDKKARILGHRHPRYDSPDYAFYVMGIVGSLLLVGNYIGMQNVQQIFWTIFALSSIIFLLPYLFMFPAVWKLRRTEPDTERPYRVPGGKTGLWISVVLGEFFLLLAVVFFFVPPENTENVLRYELSLIIGITITVAVGLYIHFKGERKSLSQ
jgi:amino acid transporter